MKYRDVVYQPNICIDTVSQMTQRELRANIYYYDKCVYAGIGKFAKEFKAEPLAILRSELKKRKHYHNKK